MVREGAIPKGDPLPVARVAGIQAAKQTPLLIPYCHSVPLDHASVDFELGEDRITITATATAIYHTGVEMEALSAAAVAALNLYDMLKMLDESMEIISVRLVEKTGGKSQARSLARPYLAAVVVASDRASVGERPDVSGKTLVVRLREFGAEVEDPFIVPDDVDAIRAEVVRLVDDGADLVFVSGGTGLGPRDVTPEALESLLDRRLPGVEEHLRAYGQKRLPYTMLSRSIAGVRGRCVVIAIPGSPKAADEAVDALFPYVLHALDVLGGACHGE
jgi:molybdenum cofactor biosynthesis protein MoaC